MAAPLDLRWRVVGIGQPEDTEVLDAPVVNPQGAIRSLQSVPGLTEQTRLRQTWSVCQSTPSVPGISLPTTLAGITLWNGEQACGKLYLIQRIFAFNTTSVAAISPIGLCHLINVGPKNAPASAGLTIRGLAGQRYSGAARVGVGITVTNDGWEPIGTSVIAATSQIGAGVEAQIDGFYVVKPGFMYSVFVLMNSGAVARTVAGIQWTEVQLPIRG